MRTWKLILAAGLLCAVTGAFAQESGSGLPPQNSDVPQNNDIPQGAIPPQGTDEPSSEPVNNDTPSSSQKNNDVVSSEGIVQPASETPRSEPARSSAQEVLPSSSSSQTKTSSSSLGRSSVASSSSSRIEKSSLRSSVPSSHPASSASSLSSSGDVSSSSSSIATESGAALMFFPRSELGYSSPVIDPLAVIHIDRFSLDPRAIVGNLLWSLLTLVVLWSSAVLLGQLMLSSPVLMTQIMRRLPWQILLTFILFALYRFVVPGVHAQGIAMNASASFLQIPVGAFIFFAVVGLSNTLFNNLLTAEGDRLHAVLPIPSERILRSVWVIILLSLLYAVIGGYINPGFSILPSRDLGMIFVTLISVLLSAYFKDSLSFLLARRKKIDAWFQGNLAGLLIAIGCVWLTRTFGFDPGYIYGIPAGLVVGAHLSHAEEGRLEAAGMVSGLVIALVVWLLGSVLTGTEVPLDLCNLVFVILAEDAFFDMIPLPTLAGSAIYSWNRGAWALLCVIVTFLLFHTLLNPQGTVSGILGQPPALGAVLLLGCYAVFVLLLWAIVTYRNREE